MLIVMRLCNKILASNENLTHHTFISKSGPSEFFYMGFTFYMFMASNKLNMVLLVIRPKYNCANIYTHQY